VNCSGASLCFIVVCSVGLRHLINTVSSFNLLSRWQFTSLKNSTDSYHLYDTKKKNMCMYHEQQNSKYPQIITFIIMSTS